jgi:hypothetical protein
MVHFSSYVGTQSVLSCDEQSAFPIGNSCLHNQKSGNQPNSKGLSDRYLGKIQAVPQYETVRVQTSPTATVNRLLDFDRRIKTF